MKTMGAFISEVYTLVNNNPGSTAGELFEVYQSLYPHTKRSRGEIAKRLTDLLDRDLVRKTGTKVCEFSGCAASTWSSRALGSFKLHSGAAEQQGGVAEDAGVLEKEECCGGGCGSCSCGEVKESSESNLDDFAEMSEHDVVVVEEEDRIVLRECHQTLEQIETKLMTRMLINSVPGMKTKLTKLKKALRYF